MLLALELRLAWAVAARDSTIGALFRTALGQRAKVKDDVRANPGLALYGHGVFNFCNGVCQPWTKHLRQAGQ